MILSLESNCTAAVSEDDLIKCSISFKYTYCSRAVGEYMPLVILTAYFLWDLC